MQNGNSSGQREKVEVLSASFILDLGNNRTHRQTACEFMCSEGVVSSRGLKGKAWSCIFKNIACWNSFSPTAPLSRASNVAKRP